MAFFQGCLGWWIKMIGSNFTMNPHVRLLSASRLFGRGSYTSDMDMTILGTVQPSVDYNS